jgi:hypothetical protein
MNYEKKMKINTLDLNYLDKPKDNNNIEKKYGNCWCEKIIKGAFWSSIS